MLLARDVDSNNPDPCNNPTAVASDAEPLALRSKLGANQSFFMRELRQIKSKLSVMTETLKKHPDRGEEMRARVLAFLAFFEP